jgi:dTDP-4-amino-4,6-dideoxygalactose transaminase
MGKQPFYLKKYPDAENNLPNAEKVRVFGMYLPNHHLLIEEDIEKVCNVVKRYL